jgi:lysophospholipase L1-like esterase
MRFLALGDSYTIGESVAVEDRWPARLTRLLREAGFDIDSPTIIAARSWTTAHLSAAMDHAHLVGPYDLVSLLIGVNNQYDGRSEEEYDEQFAALLKRAIGLAGEDPACVLVLSIPDWSVTPFAEGRDRAAIAAAIDRFNAINRDEAERAGARYIDVTPISREAADDETSIADDGLHPSGKMYAEWARLAFPAACAAIQS